MSTYPILLYPHNDSYIVEEDREYNLQNQPISISGVGLSIKWWQVCFCWP